MAREFGSVTFRSSGGFFLCAEAEGRNELNATRTVGDAWEKFGVVMVEEPNKIALRAVNGRYVRAVGGGGGALIADRDEIKGHETYTLVTADGGGYGLRTYNDLYICAELGGGGIVVANRPVLAAWETWHVSQALGAVEPRRVVAGPLRRDGRGWTNDDGVFYPVFASALAIAAKPAADAERYLDHCVAAGFNGVRFFLGSLGWANLTAGAAIDALPRLLFAARERGLYVQVCPITGSGDGSYDPRAYVRLAIRECMAFIHTTVEAANEFYHPTQSRDVHDPENLIDYLRGAPMLAAIGAPAEDEPITIGDAPAFWPYPTADFTQLHLGRQREAWEMVRHAREMELVAQMTGRPVMNGEPIGAADVAERGRRESRPELFAGLGAINRIMGLGGVFHSQSGLWADLPTDQIARCEAAFVAGSRCIPSSDRLAFKNAGWVDSPIVKFDGSKALRAYTGVAGARAWTLCLGVTGDPALQLRDGWALRDIVYAQPGLMVFELSR